MCSTKVKETAYKSLVRPNDTVLGEDHVELGTRGPELNTQPKSEDPNLLTDMPMIISFIPK